MAAPFMVPCLLTLIWMILSTCVILTNKYVQNTYPYTITLTTFHLLFSVLGTQILIRTPPFWGELRCSPMTGNLYWRCIVPIGAILGLNLILNNIAYQHLTVSFIQMFKSISPVVTLIVGWLSGLYHMTQPIIVSLSLICIGVMLSSFGELNFDAIGLFIQSAAIVSEAVRLILMDTLLLPRGVRLTALLSLYYFAPPSALCCLMIAFVMEGPSFSSVEISVIKVLALLGNTSLAFLLNIISILVIKYTSSLTLSVCGTPRAIMTIAASVWIWREPISAMQLQGFVIASVGLLYYTRQDNGRDAMRRDPLGCDDASTRCDTEDGEVCAPRNMEVETV